MNDNRQDNPACYSKESLHVVEVKHYHTGRASYTNEDKFNENE
jgi:hypothetical protein